MSSQGSAANHEITALGDSPDPNRPVAIAICCLLIILALVVGVGLASHLVLRHLVQTVQLWFGVILGFRHAKAAAWVALPSFLCWLFLMGLIWAYLLGFSHLINGHFSPIEIIMTLIVGSAAVAGIIYFARSRSGLQPLPAAGIFVAMGLFQFGCLYVSFLPAIANR